MSNIISYMINSYFRFLASGRKRPVFFDIEETRPELLELDRHFHEIKTEWDALDLNILPGYHQVDPYQGNLARENKPTENWQVFLLQAMGATPSEAQKHFSKTLEWINQVPQVFQAFFSILPPGKSIARHSGSFMGYLRYHLGITVPVDVPPQLHIHQSTYTWRQAESVLFDDSWSHEVVNHCKERRVILIVDILRPMPFPASWFNRYLLFPFIKMAYGRQLVKRFSQALAH
ncbi:aspartyl/asparaginyl beta-hydroxylase domain-containing protein [bacterium]|nr:aspartyl/asparaginyl beta-hydroxylase domain-containing protein [bacterium]